MRKSNLVELNPDEYAPYYREYTEHVTNGTLVDIMNADRAELNALFSRLSDQEALHRYAPGKWSIKEILVHCMDTEVIFNARALMFARGEEQAIPGYDHEAFVKNSRADKKSLDDLSKSWSLLRENTLNMFGGFNDTELKRMGNANGNKMSVRSLIYIIPGHVLHHLGVIREKYGIDF